MELYNIDAKKLDKFIFDNLQISDGFQRQVRREIDIICTFLKENCFKGTALSQTRVLKVVKGGSWGKGTALKGGSDADLVVFLNTFKGYEDQERDRKRIIQETEGRLLKCCQDMGIEVHIEQTRWSNPRVLSFTLYSKDFKESMEFDVLPAFDTLGQYRGNCPDPQVYIDLFNSSHDPESQFSPCFTELQRDFVKKCPPKVKNLIRLVKYWYKKLKGRKLPPKYALELLAIYAWEEGSGETDFDMAEGFRTVLWLIQQYKDLCIFWTIYYDFQNDTLKQHLHKQLQKPRPIILDPADPTGILGEGSHWDLLAAHAADAAVQRCCRKSDGSMVQPWAVPLQVPWEQPSNCTIL